MITRAQAEALLTPAESLEACERANVTLEVGSGEATIRHPGGGFCIPLIGFGKIGAEALRMMVHSETLK